MTCPSDGLQARREQIPVGRENAITRQALAVLWGVDDRTARDYVARMRAAPSDDPHVICSSSHHPPGYWRTDDAGEIDRYIRETEARAKNTLAAAREARRFRAGGE